MYCEVSELLGKTLVAITGADEGNNEIIFECSDGSKYRMYHEQDCCESVLIEDICGYVNSLIGNPLTMAEDITNIMDKPAVDKRTDSCTWTWYKFATVKGYVTIRWYGESNGYYSERVDFEKMEG
jgi:hypothetical protein